MVHAAWPFRDNLQTYDVVDTARAQIIVNIITTLFILCETSLIAKNMKLWRGLFHLVIALVKPGEKANWHVTLRIFRVSSHFNLPLSLSPHKICVYSWFILCVSSNPVLQVKLWKYLKESVAVNYFLHIWRPLLLIIHKDKNWYHEEQRPVSETCRVCTWC